MQVTSDTIVDYFRHAVEEKLPISPHAWVDGAQKLNVLLGDETDKLFDLQQQVAQERLKHIEAGDSVAKANVKVETTDIFKQMQKKKARVEQIEEMIRIAKLQARLKEAELNGYNL